MLNYRTASIVAILLASISLGIWIEREAVIRSLQLRPKILTYTEYQSPVNSPPAPGSQPQDEQLSAQPKQPGSVNILSRDKVAAITDTQFSPNLIPLIMHFQAVLGASWPIVFFTTQQVIDEHLTPRTDNTTSKSPQNLSGSWMRAVEEGTIEVRALPTDRFNLTSRKGVNLYLSDKWLWEQLAPAQHVLLFQTDAIICANSPFVIEDFLKYDFVGAYMGTQTYKLYNGGLSLRNRTMLLDILNEDTETLRIISEGEGEDGYFSRKMGERGGNMPEPDVASMFALQYKRTFDKLGRPFGYHKIQKNVPDYIPDIARWCPEIALTQMGNLAG